jgi:hypothetical protein
MEKKNFKKTSLTNLILSYVTTLCFIILIITGIKSDDIKPKSIIALEPDLNTTVVSDSELALTEGVNQITYIDRTPTTTNIVREIDSGRTHSVVVSDDLDHFTYKDRLDGVIINGDGISENYSVGSHINNETSHIKTNRDRDIVGNRAGIGLHSSHNGINAHAGKAVRDRPNDVDFSILDRRLAELDQETDSDNLNFSVKKDNGDAQNEFKNFVPVGKNDDSELGDIDFNFKPKGAEYGAGKGGELYAYNFPSQGIGAGVGASSVGAAAAGGVGLSAGVGQAVLDGETVPALGGVGTSPSPSNPSNPPLPSTDGVGGLLGGAGAGGAAGLMHGSVTEKLGMGAGCSEHGANCEGHGGRGGHRGYNSDHLPANGSLHIMIHVDGSGSILSTRKQLDIMKDTLLKDALLPYYNNDESLYNNRVSIIADSGERTLKFFSKAAERENVLAVAFQDEAQPSYHLPNFNRKPEGDYLDDLKVLKSKLNSHDGIYRGIMFQVDRGKTFAKSFKEFVGNAFQGKGYLKNQNLKQYHWQGNLPSIKQKNGIVFSDEYHAKDEGTPEYYLDLLFKASKKVGLDLNTYGAGLTDGKHVKSD